jgi:hypothetical protein
MESKKSYLSRLCRTPFVCMMILTVTAAPFGAYEQILLLLQSETILCSIC